MSKLTEPQLRARHRELTAVEIMTVKLQVRHRKMDDRYFRLLRIYRTVHAKLVQCEIDLGMNPHHRAK